jgi:hypothetical protein
MSPSAHTSVAGRIARLHSVCSGALHRGEPHGVVPSACVRCSSWRREMPKSSTFTVPSRVTVEVLGLEVAVDDPRAVRGADALTDLSQERPGLFGGERSARFDDGVEVFAHEELHERPGEARGGVDAAIVHGHDVRAHDRRAQPSPRRESARAPCGWPPGVDRVSTRGCSVLSARRRPRLTCSTAHTTTIPPAPTSRTMRKRSAKEGSGQELRGRRSVHDARGYRVAQVSGTALACWSRMRA